MPSETFCHSVHISTDPATVIAALERADTWKGLGPIEDVWDAKVEDNRLIGFQWSAKAAGKTWKGTADRAGEPGAGPLQLDLDSSDLAATITVDIAADGSGSNMTVEMTARSKSFMARTFWGVISGALRTGLPGQVEAFAAQF
jgi:hypothetical protein